MEAYFNRYTGKDLSAAEEFSRLSEILQGFRPKYIAPGLLHSWANLNTALYSPAGYYKDPFGRVWLRGALKSGILGQSAFVLPEGYRPITTIYCTAQCFNGASYIHGTLVVSPAGLVIPTAGANNEFWLDNISLAAEQ